MAKEKQEQEKEDFYYVPLTNAQLAELHIEVIQKGGKEKFLELEGVATYIKGFEPSVRYSPSRTGTKVRENWEIYYENPILYRTWDKIFEQLERYRYGLEKGRQSKLL